MLLLDGSGSSTALSLALVPAAFVSTAAAAAWYANRLRRSKWTTEEDRDHGHETTHSVIDHFKSLILDPKTTVEEANKRRTTSYYLKMRESHSKSLVLGVGPYSKLVSKREGETNRILRYWKKGNLSHRAIVVMLDEKSRKLLADARREILEPLEYSSDITTRGVWIPSLNIIPEEDMHITTALPWWWHTILPGNDELTRNMARRFKQTLLLDFHFPFQIELERIILLGGKVLVALWRCVGDRIAEDGQIVHDRHGENIDPMIRLREEIIRCFITESPDQRRKPLTYHHRRNNESDEFIDPSQHTITQRTPGVGVTADGFIHTTLCRLPLECLSLNDIELDKVHRLCREASATLSGHRMVIGKYRFLETMGQGGESNPCVNPLYDETIEAPHRHEVDIDGTVKEQKGLQSHIVSNSLTIGPEHNFWDDIEMDDEARDDCENDTGGKGKLQPSTLSALFQPPPAS